MKIIKTKTTICLTEKEIRMVQNVYDFLEDMEDEIASIRGLSDVNKEDIMNWILEYGTPPQDLYFMVISEEENERDD